MEKTRSSNQHTQANLAGGNETIFVLFFIMEEDVSESYGMQHYLVQV